MYDNLWVPNGIFRVVWLAPSGQLIGHAPHDVASSGIAQKDQQQSGSEVDSGMSITRAYKRNVIDTSKAL